MAARIRSLAVALALLVPAAARAQQPDTSAFYRALDLEGAGKYQAAARLYRQALAQPANRVSALLGLERAYAELNWTDSLLAPLDSLLAIDPRQPTFRTVQLRAYTMLARDAARRRTARPSRASMAPLRSSAGRPS